MKLHELKAILARHPAAHIRFQLPDGEFAPAHSHVTEVARIDKRFIDCGGTLRTDTLCRLQTWSADDVEHRLTAGKLTKIFTLAESVLLTDDLDVDIEHELGHITQFPLGSVEAGDNEIVFHLTERHTACLAMDKCLPPVTAQSELNPLKFNFTGKPPASKCC
ncbi:MAG TPA: DUF6428 family protein [Verrucomicrobiae bacterium]|nr:DUF6428 family protein [Verrucomicrobiae bacterium]